MDVKKQPPEVTTFVLNQLGLPSSAKEIALNTMYDAFAIEVPIQPDIVLKHEGILYFIQIKKSSVTIDTIARMRLLKELWQKRGNTDPIILVIAAKWFYQREESIAKELGIRLIRLPLTLSVSGNKDHPSSGMRITSEKSWKIVTRLLKEKSTSIRQLSQKENVSYGWAHKVIGMLLEQDVVKKENNYVHFDDLKNLLNAIAWERPLKNLQVDDEMYIQSPGAFAAAQQVSVLLKEQKIPCAFTSYTSGGLYTGYAIRQDAIYLYLEKKNINEFKKQFGTEIKSGVRVHLYIPDREVFTYSREMESVTVTSPAQTLLDLAGLGYSAMDLTRVMAEKYADL
jgi:DNA-binding Lrp family transcriptional regulator